jgi:hypothetical protein
VRLGMAETPYRLVAIIIVTFLSLSGRGQAQEVDTRAQGLVNQPSSPLRIGVSSNGRHVEADNVSSGTVIEYQTGCVAEEVGKITIRSQFKPVKVELAPAGSGKALWFTEIDFKDLDLCREKNAKLAVIRVSFADGSEWRIKP